MPLNYSKWDNIEISDDEDIECHPNVDKKSFIKWNQEAIHQRRAERRNKIKQLTDAISMNAKVIDKVAFIIEAAGKSDTQDFKTTLSHIQSSVLENPSSANGSSNQESPSLDKHLVGLFAHIQGKLHEEKVELNKDNFMVKLREEFEIIKVHQKKCQEDLAAEEKIENSTLTSDTICKPGFDKTVLNSTAPPPEPKKTTKKKTKEKQVEILNPKTLETHPVVKSPPKDDVNQVADESDGDDIEISDIGLKFAKAKSFDESLSLISKHPYLISEQYSDEILAHAFEVEMKKNFAFAKQCVHQSLVLQYCNRLGKDGVGLFFARLKSQGFEVFTKDVQDTYKILKERCLVLIEKSSKESKEKAIFQLEPSTPDSQLTVYVPTEDEPERYELFLSLPEVLQSAFKIGTIEALNDALKDLDEQEAEQALQTCDQGQFILFEVPGEPSEVPITEGQSNEVS